MKHFIDLKDIPKSDLRKIIQDAKKKYQYQEYGAKFDVFGESPSLRR